MTDTPHSVTSLSYDELNHLESINMRGSTHAYPSLMYALHKSYTI